MAKRKSKSRKSFSLESTQEWCKKQAEYNRQNAGKWELILYRVLKDLHYKFEFQHPIIYKKKPYIVDFLLLDYNIFIEADGKQWHSTPAQKRADNLRTKRLQTLGYQPLRFTNSQISTISKETIDQIIKTKIANLLVKEG